MTFFTLRSLALRASQLREAGLATSAGKPSSQVATMTAVGTEDPAAAAALDAEEGCTFCDIASGKQEAQVVYSDADTVAFLDVYPIRPGHTLVVPRKHCEMLSRLPTLSAAALGISVSRVARGIAQACGDDRLQVCANQVHAQTVPHAHYHIVPAPPLPGTEAAKKEAERNKGSQWFFSHGRAELDEQELAEIATKIRKAIASDTPDPILSSKL